MNIKAYAGDYVNSRPNSRGLDYQSVRTISIQPYKLLITVAVILLFTLLLIWSRIGFIAENYNMSAIASETQKLTQQIDQYNLEIATLKSRNRIENIARARLDLRYPDTKQIILIDR